jgi:hypothetical protein
MLWVVLVLVVVALMKMVYLMLQVVVLVVAYRDLKLVECIMASGSRALVLT